MFFSQKAVSTAFKAFRGLTGNPAKQGQTQVISALRYTFALDSMKKSKQEKNLPPVCDTRNNGDRAAFFNAVGDFVKLDDGYYSVNMYNRVDRANDFNTGSNFFSAGVVKNSIEAPDKGYEYPSRGGKYPALIGNIKNGILYGESIDYERLNDYIGSSSLKTALLIWLLRAGDLGKCENENDVRTVVSNSLKRRYTDRLVEALHVESFSFNELGLEFEDCFSDKAFSVTSGVVKMLAQDETVSIAQQLNKPYNWIFFGAPGTGKSYELNHDAQACFGENIRRVTFYPDYTYSQFVGGYKPFPVMEIDSANVVEQSHEGAEGHRITYDFIPGPFLQTYVEAQRNQDKNYLLIIEEINRSNPAAVFGDVFQLLDRKADGESVYPIDVPREMELYLKKELIDTHKNDDATINKEGMEGFQEEAERRRKAATKLRLPENMYIWATMNSADQGVFPMDTAFKRRWNFRYMGIDNGEGSVITIRNNDVKLDEIVVPCGKHNVTWNSLRHAINDFMTSDALRINEDKLLGPFFISPESLVSERIGDILKDKVLMYLYEDVAKTKRSKMFKKGLNTYSQICDEFDEIGVDIFGDGFDKSLIVQESSSQSADAAEA